MKSQSATIRTHPSLTTQTPTFQHTHTLPLSQHQVSKHKTKKTMSYPTEHKHADFLCEDRQNAPIEVQYSVYANVQQPWDLEKVDNHPDHEVWVKWNTLYVRFGKYENLPENGGDGSSTLYQYDLDEPSGDYKYPDNDLDDWMGNGEDGYKEDMYCEEAGCGVSGASVLLSRHDLIPRCKECEEKLGRYQSPERRIAGEKIKAWCLEKLYNPHTKIGRKFAEHQIAWAFEEVAKKKKAGKSRRLKIVAELVE